MRPLVVYLFIWITIGFYAIYWYLRAVEYLNSIDSKHNQNTRKIKIFVLVFLAVYVSGFFYVFTGSIGTYALPEENPAFHVLLVVLFLMAVSWNVLVPAALFLLALRLRRIQRTQGINRLASPWRTLLAYCLWFVSFPYLQHHLNALSESENHA